MFIDTLMSTKYDLSKKRHGTYKNLNHRSNYCKLSGDIEINPGPTFVNPSKTIFAPYSQGSIDVFGENAGRQHVLRVGNAYVCEQYSPQPTQRQH